MGLAMSASSLLERRTKKEIPLYITKDERKGKHPMADIEHRVIRRRRLNSPGKRQARVLSLFIGDQMRKGEESHSFPFWRQVFQEEKRVAATRHEALCIVAEPSDT